MTVLAALLVPALMAAASPTRAADPALVAKVESYLRNDEKAFLAGILVRPDLSAEFDREAPLALKDPKNLTPFLGVWRGKLVAYAEVDGKLPYPDLDGHYTSYSQLMTPTQRAYMMRRMKTMTEDERNSLIDYLKSVNDALTKNGQLTWYTKKVVSGILKQYRLDLNTYLATPIAQDAKRNAAASSTAFAAIEKTTEEARTAAARPVHPAPAEVAAAPVVKPPVKPAPPKKPAPATKPVVPPAPETDGGSVVARPPSGGALDQARDAAGSGAPVFDGNSPAPKGPVGGGADVVAPSGPGTARPTLSPAGPGGESGLVGSIPSVPSPATGDDMDALLKLRGSKPAHKSWIQRAPAVAGGLLGGILGALIGFLVGGPVGAIVGGAIGAGAGAGGGYLLGKKLFQ